MVFHIDHKFLLIGKPTVGFSKNYFYEWDDGLGGDKAQLFLNFHTNSPDLPGDQLGNAIFDVMKNYFFHDLSRSMGERFEDMLKEVNAEVRNQEKELGEKVVPHLHVVAAAISGNALYLSQYGDAEAYLIRRRYVSLVSEDLSDPKNHDELFQNIANGDLASGDYVLFCSTRLLRYITKPDLGRLLSGGVELEMALEAINDAVSLDLMDRMSVVGIRVGEEEMMTIEGDDIPEKTLSHTRGARFSQWGETLKLSFGKLIPAKKVRSEVPSKEAMPEETFEQEKVLDEDSELEAHRASIHTDVMDVGESMPIEESESGSSDFSELLKEWKALKRDKILIALIVVVVILIGGIYLVRHQGRKQNYIDELEGKLATVELDLNTARTTGAYDKTSAGVLLAEAETLSLEVLNSGYLRGKASEYLSEIETQRDRLDGVQRIENPEVFVDFAMTNPEMNALGITSMGGNLYVYEHNKLYEILLDQIQAPVTIDDKEVLIDSAYFDDRESLFFLTKSNRILEYKEGQVSFVDTADAAWHSAKELAIYNGRVYLLDPEQGQIWRYYQQRNGFSGADPYITDDSFLKDAVSFAIDGGVYVLHDDGSINKFSSGEIVDDFVVKKSPSVDSSGATRITTEFEMFQTFVLDPAGSRILVYNKDARSGDLVYSSQFILDNVEELKDLYVDKESSRLYVLGKTKIYVVPF